MYLDFVDGGKEGRLGMGAGIKGPRALPQHQAVPRRDTMFVASYQLLQEDVQSGKGSLKQRSERPRSSR